MTYLYPYTQYVLKSKIAVLLFNFYLLKSYKKKTKKNDLYSNISQFLNKKYEKKTKKKRRLKL